MQAIARLRAAGYATDLFVEPGGALRCRECGETLAASSMTVDEIVRFEGDSNPDDEAILFAITTPLGHRGLFAAAYGSGMTADEVDVLRALG